MYSRAILHGAKWVRRYQPKISPGSTSGKIQFFHPFSLESTELDENASIVLASMNQEFSFYELYYRIVKITPVHQTQFEEMLTAFAKIGLIEPAHTSPRFESDISSTLLRILVQPRVYFLLFSFLAAYSIYSAPLIFKVLKYSSLLSGRLIAFGGAIGALSIPLLRQSFRTGLASANNSRPIKIKLKLKGIIPFFESELRNINVSPWVFLTSGYFFDFYLIDSISILIRSGQTHLVALAEGFLAIELIIFFTALNPLLKHDFHAILSRLFGLNDPRINLAKVTQRLWKNKLWSWKFAPTWAYWFLSSVYKILVCAGILIFFRHHVSGPVLLGLLAITLLFWAKPYLGRMRGMIAQRAHQPSPQPPAELSWIRRTIDLPSKVLESPSVQLASGWIRELDWRAYSAASLSSQIRLFFLDPASIYWHQQTPVEKDSLLEPLCQEVLRRPLHETSSHERGLLRAAYEIMVQEGLPLSDFKCVSGLRFYDGPSQLGMLDTILRFEDLSLKHILTQLSKVDVSSSARFRDRAELGFQHRVSGKFHAFVFIRGPRQIEATTQHLAASFGENLSQSNETLTLESVLKNWSEKVPDTLYLQAAQLRNSSVQFFKRYGIIPCFDPPPAHYFNDAQKKLLSEMGLFRTIYKGPENYKNVWMLKGPGLIVPLRCPSSAPGLKVRYFSQDVISETPSGWLGHLRRYDFFYRTEIFDSPFYPSSQFEELRSWFHLNPDDDEIAVFEGEIKAMAYHYLSGKSAVSIGGLGFPALERLSKACKNMKTLKKVFLCFDNDSSLSYRTKRRDGLCDSSFRGLQLAALLRDQTHLEVLWVEGLTGDQGKKLDIDELIGLPEPSKTEFVSHFFKNKEKSKSLNKDLGQFEVKKWVDHSVEISRRFYRLYEQKFELTASGVPSHSSQYLRWHQETLSLYEKALHAKENAFSLSGVF